MHSSQARRRGRRGLPQPCAGCPIGWHGQGAVRTFLTRRRRMRGARGAVRRGCVNPDLSFVDNDSGRLLR
ncbi:hypothetical protein CBM2631_B150051 [Cupriavidus taiwanensis]|nr:hypothetical protein CBM2617_B150052 [Cupriavidus taiwanensis]SOZ85766.1 hypothetical protein CBM2618_B160009 [Cupriavidus taiwanensis]SOZ89028.1 hypothetical protein CBM2622_B160052 [Cupriavidus taiwanensis]SOZ94185.1 hypothetical protein CBM2621_B160053 [Cupriavidus taiwanensis]SPA19922.1 hypothetical protein CBM2631_B150051 [Cupriavidus taiwanensis]